MGWKLSKVAARNSLPEGSERQETFLRLVEWRAHLLSTCSAEAVEKERLANPDNFCTFKNQ
jgi:hypothetical protein